MADTRIQDLTRAESVQLNDLFVLEQSGAAKALTGQILINDLADALDGHGGIADISYTAPVSPSITGTMTITMADETTYSVSVTNGRGISSISWATSGTAGDGQTHTGTISYNDGTTSTVQFKDGVKGNTGAQTYVWFKWAQDYPSADSDMQNNVGPWIGVYSGTSSTAPTSYQSYTWYQYKGTKGDTGSSIQSIAKTSSSGLVDTYTITMTDTSTTTFTVTNAKSIVSVTLTSGNHAAGTTDLYTITFNDGDTSTFSVYNGANGLGSVSTVSGIQADGNGDVPQVISGSGAPTTATVGQENQLYFDTSSGGLYYCLGETGGSYSWAGTSVTVDGALSTSSTNPVQNKVITSKVGTTTLNTTATDLSGAVNEVLAAIPSASSTTPQKDGTGSAGNGTTWARSNHVHPLNVPSSGAPSDLGTPSNGSATDYARSDHVHKMPTASDVGATPSGQGIPSGGTSGQFLQKNSSTNYDASWATIPSASWETETLATNLTIYRQGNMRMLSANGCSALNPIYTLAAGDRPSSTLSAFGLQGTTASNRTACFFRVFDTGAITWRTFSGALISSGEGWGQAFWTV